MICLTWTQHFLLGLGARELALNTNTNIPNWKSPTVLYSLLILHFFHAFHSKHFDYGSSSTATKPAEQHFEGGWTFLVHDYHIPQLQYTALKIYFNTLICLYLLYSETWKQFKTNSPRCYCFIEAIILLSTETVQVYQVNHIFYVYLELQIHNCNWHSMDKLSYCTFIHECCRFPMCLAISFTSCCPLL